MDNNVIEVRRAKSINILLIILCSFTEIIFGGLTIWSIITILSEHFQLFDDLLAYIFLSIFSFTIFIVILVLCIFLMYESLIQVDVFLEDKMYRKKGDKIIFEIEYSQIDTIKEGFFAFTYTFCIFCKEPIIKKNGKKGAKTLIEYYSRKDREKVKQIIASYFELNKIAY